MSISIKEIDQKIIDEAVKLNSIVYPIEQTTIWQEFDKSVTGRRAVGVFGVYIGNKLIATAAITTYYNKGYCWWWVKYGPIFIGKPQPDDIKKVVLAIKKMALASKDKIAFVRMTLPESDIKLHNQLHKMMYDRTIIIDLSLFKDAASILQSYTRHGRYEVNQSLKKGVVVSKVPNSLVINKFDDYYAILTETAKRDGFYALPKKIYLTMLKSMSDNVSFYLAKYDDQAVSWAIVTTYNGYSKYYYAASSNLARKCGAAYAIQYYIMCDLHSQSVKYYDLMGIESPNHPELKHVTGFKKKFSKDIVELNKTYDLVCSPIIYNLIKSYTKAKKAVTR